MARVTEQDVIKLMDTALTEEEMTPFLELANVQVTASLTGKGLGSEQLKKIELNLAACFACAKDPYVVKQTTGRHTVEYAGKFGDLLRANPYGQIALLLDTSGTLAALTTARSAAKVETLEL
uniref:Uncharacterized protein n=1 Tax=viral metagenome TaxID=1070528 RepID=A0A6M3IQL8_9ZZZZ